MKSKFQMINRDTGAVVFEEIATGWRQFRLAYVQWSQTTQQGILPLELQDIVRVEPTKALELHPYELRLIGRALATYDTEPARELRRRIKVYLDQT